MLKATVKNVFNSKRQRERERERVIESFTQTRESSFFALQFIVITLLHLRITFSFCEILFTNPKKLQN